MNTTRKASAATLIAVLLGIGPVQGQKGWLQSSFEPQQCLMIRKGEFEVRRKLCTIRYEITSQGDLFRIDGFLAFNKKFVPDLPRGVELEVFSWMPAMCAGGRSIWTERCRRSR